MRLACALAQYRALIITALLTASLPPPRRRRAANRAGAGIKDITPSSDGLTATVTFTDNRDPVTLALPRGLNGSDGAPGAPGKDGVNGTDGALSFGAAF